ncbi:hypothetical protein WMY93_002862 [Mugilogobius chulae]|uniref:Uncharacterized protein n=1 Tax=Mugilogobius chulae TaxID=88201 RepID=A0AAW0PUY3_9GOBI
MSDEDLLKNIDSLLFQCALRTRELSQKKNQINQQIEVYRDDIAKAKTAIETTKANIKGLEEDIKTKQNTLTQNKAIAKSMKTTNSLVLHYEQTLKAELENRKANYNRDREEYEKKIASYKSSFHSYKEYYYNNPLAQKLLGLQAENREIETKIKSSDDLITLKQEELDNLTAPVIEMSSPEKPSESEQLENEPEKQEEQKTMEDSSCSLQKTKEHHILSEEVCGEHVEEAQSASISCLLTEDIDVGDSQQIDGKFRGLSFFCTRGYSNTYFDFSLEPHDEETENREDPETEPQDPSLEQQFTILEIEQVMEAEMDEGPGETQTANQEADEALTSLSQEASSQETNQPASQETKPGLATPTFPFTFSPSRSPQNSNPSKSPAFPFNIHSEPSTPGFFGFGVQDEDPASPFTSSFFGEKKTTESKSSMEFLFNQPEPSEAFQFSFNAKSPDKHCSKDKAGGDFPFSFNF